MKNNFILFLLLISFSTSSQKLPKGFVYLLEIDATIRADLRYYTNNNFIGTPIDGYKKDCIIVSRETAKALKSVQKNLLKQGLSLKILDAYRPQQSANLHSGSKWPATSHCNKKQSRSRVQALRKH